jgi:formyl-CoA transferase
MGISFLAQNAGKASVTLDLKAAAGKDILRQLVGQADILVENFRPGVMDRLDLGYDTLRKVNPRLVYCAISGFGQTGPRRDDPAYDQIVQGVSGVMSITGTPETAPCRVGYPLADTMGGMTAAFAIAAALQANPRGTFLDVAMTEAVLSSMGWAVSNHLIGGVEPAAHGNENTTSAPSGTFDTADNPINIAANRDSQWASLIGLLGLEGLATHPDYRTREDRKRNRHALRAALEEVLKTRPAAHWVQALNAIGVPAGPVLGVADALLDPQVAGRGLVGQMTLGDGTIALSGSPVMRDGTRAHPHKAPPRLGQDTDDILKRLLGFGDDRIAALRQEGVI